MQKYEIPVGKLLHHYAVLIIIGIVQVSMIVCFLGEQLETEKHPDFRNPVPFAGKLCRFACAIVMHCKLVPEFAKAMQLMKFANNNPELFINSKVAFAIGLQQFFVALIVEV